MSMRQTSLSPDRAYKSAPVRDIEKTSSMGAIPGGPSTLWRRHKWTEGEGIESGP